MSWHEEMKEKLNSAIVVAGLLGYNVLYLKKNKIWITNEDLIIQIMKHGEDVLLVYKGAPPKVIYTIAEAKREIINLL